MRDVTIGQRWRRRARRAGGVVWSVRQVYRKDRQVLLQAPGELPLLVTSDRLFSLWEQVT